MGGRAGQQQTQTSTTTLPPGQQQNVDLLMQGARDFYNTGGPKFYPGQTYAGTTAQELAGRQGAQAYAQGPGQNFVNQYQGGENFWLNPENIFNPGNIPGFNRAQQGVTQGVTQNLTENILPGIRGQNIATGSLGGSRGGITEGLAIGRTNQYLGDTLANMNMQAFGQGQNMYNAAAARAPQTYGLGLAPANTMEDVGSRYRADEQLGIDESVKRFNFEQLAPLFNLQTLQALTGTQGQYGGTTTQNATSNVSGGNTGALQGLGSILTLLSMFGG